MKRTLRRLEERHEQLTKREIYELWTRVKAATERGEDLLGSLAVDIRRRTEETRERLEALRKRKGFP